MKQLLPFLFACITSIAVSQPMHNIIPAPASVQFLADATPFTVRPTTAIVVQHSSLLPQAQYLQQYLQRYYKRTLTISTTGNETNNIVLKISKVNTHGNEGYTLSVTPHKVVITANAGAGIFYGIQSLIQLIPTAVTNNISIPSLTVNDAPRFTYRGMHLDVSRHFYDVNFIKKYIDWLALHKFNFFHWHLTDDQGWRIEIKK
ncbi:MAG: glycoside hydrolase family 20 zincin-like fold domain-containing protein, partial [Chitinophagaceae bacterium]